MKDLDCYGPLLLKVQALTLKYFCSQAFFFFLKTTSLHKHIQIIKRNVSTEGKKT